MIDEYTNFEYALIVNTDSYAGNFEREFCAYITGAVGECGVGDQEADNFEAWAKEQGLPKYFLVDLIDSYPDDRGCWRPVSMWKDKENGGFTDVIIFLHKPLNKEQFKVVTDRINMWINEVSKGKITVESCRMIKREVTAVDTDILPVENDNVSVS